MTECGKLIEKSGKDEVILLGDSLGDYGHDIGTTLPDLMRNLKLANRDLKIALQGLNPAHFVEFLDDMQEFLCNNDILHMQLPIQTASPRVLELMRRPYSREDIDRVFSLLNSVGFTEFDTHCIIGFPGEADEDFEETIDFILRHRPKYVLVSGFMESPEMEAFSFPQKVDNETKLQRLRNAEKRIRSRGIICNTDDSELSADRFRRLNLVQRKCERH